MFAIISLFDAHIIETLILSHYLDMYYILFEFIRHQIQDEQAK
jgi:hypothetical protein